MSAYFNLPLVMSDLAGLELGHGDGGPPQSQSRSKNLRTRLESTRQVRNSGICQTVGYSFRVLAFPCVRQSRHRRTETLLPGRFRATFPCGISHLDDAVSNLLLKVYC